MTKYFSYVTNVGINKIEAAYNAGETINLVEMAIGDSNGAYVEPNSAFTELVNEFTRVAINSASTDGHLIHVISYVTPTAESAEQTLREYGIYDEDGDMIIYGAYPESLIPSLESAEYLQLEIENITELENTDVVNVTVNPIVPLATELEAGIAKIINDDDVEAGVDDSKFLTISKMLKRVATSVKAGVARFATSAEAINGTDASTMLNPSSGLALLKARISSALDGLRTDYAASEYALSQVNTKVTNVMAAIEHVGEVSIYNVYTYDDGVTGSDPVTLRFQEQQNPFLTTELGSSDRSIITNHDCYYMLNSSLRWNVSDADTSIDVSIVVNATTVDEINFNTEGVTGPVVLPFQYFAEYPSGARIQVLLKVNTAEGGSSSNDIATGGTISLMYTRPSDSFATK